jgi:hypothetical protein
MNLFELVGNVTLRTAEAIGGLNSVENAATRTGGVFTKLGESVTAAGRSMTMFVTMPIAAALGYSIKAASDLNETMSKVGVVFKTSTDAVMNWSSGTLKSIGLARLSALDMASTFGDMGTSMGLNVAEAAKMSMGLVNLTGDMASFKNIKPEEVHVALTSIYTGETESLKRLGIVMTETNLKQFAKTEGIKKELKEMTQAEKVQLRYAYVTKMSANSIGDFERTQASAANQMRIFQEGLKELATKIGGLLLPAFTKKLALLNKLLDMFQRMSVENQKLGLKIAFVAMAAGPLLLAFGFLASAAGAIITFFGTIGLTASIVVVAFTGLTAALGIFGVKTLGIKAIFVGLVSIVQSIKLKITEFSTLLKAGVNPIQLVIFEIAKLIGIKTQLGQALIRVRDGFNDMVAGVKNYVTQLWKAVSTVFNDIRSVLEPFFQKIASKVLPQVAGMVGEVGSLLGLIYTRLSQVIAFIMPVWSGFWMWFKPIAVQFLDSFVDILQFAFATIKNLFRLVRQVMEGDWSGAWNTIKAIIAGAVSFMIGNVQNLYSVFIATVSRLASNAVAGLRGMKNDMVNSVLQLGSELYNAGANAMNMLWKGLQSKLGAIKSVAAEAAKSISSFLGFRSPTKEGEGKDSDKWMANLINMMVRDLRKHKGRLAEEAAKVAQLVNFQGKSSELTYIGSSTMVSPGAKNVVLQINNPKIFDKKDIDNFMNPVVNRLRKLGVGI